MNDLSPDSSTPAYPSLPQDSEPEHAYLGRQPILNRTGALSAFELLFRSGTNNHANHVDEAQATAHVIARAMGEMGVEAALGAHLGFVNLGGHMLADESVWVIPAARFVLEIPVRDLQVPERITQCEALRDAGYRLALDDLSEWSDSLPGLLPCFDYVKIDFAHCPAQRLTGLVEQLKPYGKTLVALKVETRQEYALARQLGFDLFQGYYFAKPEVLSSRRASASQASLMRLLALLLADPDVNALEAELKLNPTVVMHLMRLVNSGAFGLGRNVASVREAVMAAGLSRITRWTQLLLYADSNGLPFGSDPLVQLAAVRAHFMELAAERLRNHDQRLLDAAFLTGVFSLIDVVFGAAIEETLDGLALAVPIREAILERRGVLGQLLALAEASERGDQVTIEACCDELPPLTPATTAADSFQAAALAARQTRTPDADGA